MFNFIVQAQFINWLQESSLANAHELFLFLRYFDTAPYYLIVGAIVTALFPRKVSVNYIVLLCTSPYFNHWLKRVFDLPRPGGINKELDLINLGNHFGFPSGAAMGSILIGFILNRHIKNKTGLILAILYVLIICLSRVYLGAHFPIDIAGGLVFGFCLLEGFLFYESYVQKKFQNLRHSQQIISLILTLLLLIGLHPVSLSFELSLLTLGLIFGYRVKLSDMKISKILSLVVSISGVLVLFSCSLLKITFVTYLSMLLLGVWLSAGAHFSARWIQNKFSLKN